MTPRFAMRLPKSLFALALTLTVGLPTVSFADAPAGAVLPAKTLVLVVVVNHLKSGNVHVGDDVAYKVVTTVYGPNHEVLVPAGAEGHGTVTKSTKAGMAGKSGKLGFTCDYVLAADKTHVAFADSDLSKAGRSYNPVTFALLGGPVSLLTKGKNIDVNEGTPLVMAVGADTTVVPEDTVPPDPLVTIVPNKHKGKTVSATIKSFDAETVTFTTDGTDTIMKLKDIKQILMPDAQPAVAAAGTDAPTSK